MNDMAGAIGCSRLNRLMDQTNARRKVAAKYDKVLAKLQGVTGPTSTPGSEPVYHLYTCRLDLTKFTCTRDEFCKALMAEGVPTATHYPRSLPQQPALADFSKNDTPVADALAASVLSLPMHHDLTDEHIKIVTDAIVKVADAFRK
jgi:dTDP-4-amino-4,6-dideoxygalactose transaminase